MTLHVMGKNRKHVSRFPRLSQSLQYYSFILFPTYLFLLQKEKPDTTRWFNFYLNFKNFDSINLYFPSILNFFLNSH